MLLFLTIVGAIVIVIGFMGALFGLDLFGLEEANNRLVLMGGLAGIIGIAIIVVALQTQAPDCNTKDVKPFSLNLEGYSYNVTKVKVCDNGKIYVKGTRPEVKNPLPEVTKK